MTNDTDIDTAAALFKALSDPARLAMLVHLANGEQTVGALAAASGEAIGTVSARLKVLHQARLVHRRRAGRSAVYAVADFHVMNLVNNALDHAGEHANLPETRKGFPMTDCNKPQHKTHPHEHGPDCEHTAIRHDGHVDYLHDGHLHHPHGDHVDEHVIPVTERNPAECTPAHDCDGHDDNHVHGPNCGHEAVPHGDHVDYLVDGHLHHPHGDHCDDHGPIEVVAEKA